MPKKLNLTERTLRIHMIIKSIRYLLHSNQLIRLRIQQRTSKITSTKTNQIHFSLSKTVKSNPSKTKPIQKRRLYEIIPNDSVSTATNRHDRRTILSRNLEKITEHVVLNELSAVSLNRRKLSDAVLVNSGH